MNPFKMLAFHPMVPKGPERSRKFLCQIGLETGSFFPVQGDLFFPPESGGHDLKQALDFSRVGCEPLFAACVCDLPTPSP